MTWDEIYELAMDKGFGDNELKVKDEARWAMCCWAEEHLGYNPETQYENGEIDCVEAVLDNLDEKYKFVFDESGSIISFTEREDK